MKATGFLLLLLLALPSWAEDVTSNALVDVGTSKAVLFDDSTSPDGRYAIGWTLRPHTKNPKPIDWTLWKSDDDAAIDKFIDKYAAYLPSQVSDKDDYELVDCVVDLKEKRFLALPSEDPKYTHRIKGGIGVAWSPVGKGARCALVNNAGPDWNEDFWFITFNDGGMKQTPILDTLQKATAKVIAEKRPLVHKGYEMTFCVGNDNPQGTTPLIFHDSTVTFPFFADINQSTEDNTQVNGYVTLKLPEGTVLKVTSDTPRDDPFQDNSKLAKADHDLNDVYAQLSRKLSAAQKADLKKDQIAWIAQRDTDADNALAAASVKDGQVARDQSLFESTQKRLAELKSQLAAAH